MKKQLIIFALMLLATITRANNVEINGIYYNLIEKAKQAEVTKNPNLYAGNVVIPASIDYKGITYEVIKIGKEAFAGCENLFSLSIPNSVNCLGFRAFGGCRGLTTITIPPSIKTIEDFSFSGCVNLTAVHISDIKAWCNIDFQYTDSNPLQLAHHLFLNGVEIKDLIIPNDVTSIGKSAFYGCSEIISVTFPNCVTEIGPSAFYGCTGLESIAIPDNVKRVELGTFYGCNNLQTIILGNQLSSIELWAFSNCPKIKDVYCYGKYAPSAHTNAFSDSYIESATLHVPANYIENYRKTAFGQCFKDVIKIKLPEHTLIYKIDGVVYKSYCIEEEEAITPEPAPTKEGCTFSGWNEIPQTMPDHDVIITGYFNVNKYKLIQVSQVKN